MKIHGAWFGVAAGMMMAAACGWARAEANVNESLVQTTLYVNCNHPNASDANTGQDPNYPLATVSAGVARAKTFINTYKAGTKVWVFPGIYREAWGDQSGLQLSVANAPLVIEGTNGTADQIVLRGSVVFTNGWGSYAAGIFTNYWPHNWGVNDEQAQYGNTGLSARREMIFVNGKLLEQKTSASELKPGTFCVDEAADRVYIYPGDGFSVTGALIENAVYPRLARFDMCTNIVLRNVSVQHYNLPIWYNTTNPEWWYQGWGRALVFNSCVNVLVDGCRFEWNNSGGLAFGRRGGHGPARQITVTNSVFHFNGHGGLTGGEFTDALVVDVEASYNNWRGALASYYGWSSGGVRFNVIHRVRLRRVVARHNWSPGIWLDTDIKDVVVESSRSENNYSNGIFIEKTPGPCVVSNSVFVANYKGIKGADSENVLIQNNLAWCNGGGQISFDKNFDPGYPYTDLESGVVSTSYFRYWDIHSNMVVSCGPQQMLYQQSGFDWTKYLWNTNIVTLAARSNHWWNGWNGTAFDVYNVARTNWTGWTNTVGRGGARLGSGDTWGEAGLVMTAAAGRVAWRYYHGIIGATMDDVETAPGYPNNWTGLVTAARAESVRGYGDDCVMRLSALLQPPETGWYRFWIAGADAGRLRLSLDTNPANAGVIAEMTAPSGFQKWDVEAGQMSTGLWLQAGAKYYMEAVGLGWRDGNDDDQIAVAWQRPVSEKSAGLAREVIPAAYLQDVAPGPPVAPPVPATITWNGPGSYWGAGANWTGGTAPRNDIVTDTASLPSSAGQKTIVISNDQRVCGLRLANTDTYTYQITNAGDGATLWVGTNGLYHAGGGGQLVFGCPVGVSAPQTWLKSWTAPAIVCQRGLTVLDALTLDIRNGALEVNGLRGGGGIQTQNGGWSGTIRVYGENGGSYSGRWNMAGGTVEACANGALGKGPVYFANYNAQKPKRLLIAGNGVMLSNELHLLRGAIGVWTNHFVGVSGVGVTGVFAGAVRLGQQTTFVAPGSSMVTFTSNIRNQDGETGAVMVDGGGRVVFKGSNTYAGMTVITNGILEAANTSGSATGTGAVWIAEGGTLGGNGRVGGAVQCGAGGRMAPGASIGALSVGALTFSAGGVYEWEATTAPTCDVIQVEGTLTLPTANNSVTVEVHGTSVLHVPQVIIRYGSRTGGTTNAFYVDVSQAPDHAGQQAVIQDTGSAITLLLLPEPGFGAAVAILGIVQQVRHVRQAGQRIGAK